MHASCQRSVRHIGAHALRMRRTVTCSMVVEAVELVEACWRNGAGCARQQLPPLLAVRAAAASG